MTMCPINLKALSVSTLSLSLTLPYVDTSENDRLNFQISMHLVRETS
jgi:hypothetical protein